jgi:hypothetical protein
VGRDLGRSTRGPLVTLTITTTTTTRTIGTQVGPDNAMDPFSCQFLVKAWILKASVDSVSSVRDVFILYCEFGNSRREATGP